MKHVNILLVEDNEGDILLTTEALEEGKVLNKVDVVRDGEAAIQFLNKTGKYENASTPHVILLDVNLPKRNGHEVLHYIKQSEQLKHIPVIMLTTSSSERDIKLAYQNYANCFITKPVEVGDFLNVISTFEDFWLSIVQLPGKRS